MNWLRKRMYQLMLGLALPVLAGTAYAEPREHDGGLFVRLTGGLGYSGTGVDDGFEEVELRGPSFDFSLAAGTGIGTNFAVHATIFGWSVVDPTFEIDGQEFESDDVTLTLAAVGPGLTFYIMPANLYLTASVGAASLSMEVDGVDFESDTGIGAQVGIGKEWWIGDSWGVGLAATGNFHAVPSGGDLDDETLAGVGFGLVFSATRN